MSATFTPPLAALTTVFTPPCPTSWLVTTTSLPSQDPDFPRPGPQSCDPPGWEDNLNDLGFQYYSPAICPDGFEVGPECAVNEPRTDEGFPVVQPGETAAYCVPSGHTCTSDTTDFRGGVWGWFCPQSAFGVTGQPVTVGPALQIRWREGDLSLLETHPLTPGLSLKTTTPVPEAVPDPPTNTPTSTAQTPTPTPTSEGSSSTSTESIPTSSVESQLTTSARPTDGVRPTPNESGDAEEAASSRPGSATPTATESLSSSSAGSTSTPAASEPSSVVGGGTSDDGKEDAMDKKVVAAIALSSILIAMALSALAFWLIRRYRRGSRVGEVHPPREVGLGVWVQGGPQSSRSSIRPSWLLAGTGAAQSSSAVGRDHQGGGGGGGAGLQGVDITTQFIAELEPAYPAGVVGHIAELDASEPRQDQQRWSWLSRISTILSVRSRHGVSVMRHSNSHTSSSTRFLRHSAASSEVTLSEHARTDGWPTHVRGESYSSEKAGFHSVKTV